jgi:hypothetical protein
MRPASPAVIPTVVKPAGGADAMPAAQLHARRAEARRGIAGHDGGPGPRQGATRNPTQAHPPPGPAAAARPARRRDEFHLAAAGQNLRKLATLIPQPTPEPAR